VTVTPQVTVTLFTNAQGGLPCVNIPEDAAAPWRRERFSERYLVLRELGLIVGIFGVPHHGQIVAGLAEVFAVDDPAVEGTGEFGTEGVLPYW
jgi:hypothetical protein